ALAAIFGPRFAVLRISTLILSCGLALILWRTLRRLEAGTATSWVVVLGWIFNPVQFWLSFTYMTEIPFAFFVGAGLLALVRHLETGRAGYLAASGLALGFSGLIRQIAALYIAPIFVGLWLLQPEKSRRMAARRTVLFAACTLPFF